MIRIVEEKDILEIVNIYKYYVENTAISFEYSAPDSHEFLKRVNKIKDNYPFLVFEENNEIIGYAYASELKGRKAFNHSVEVSIYIRKDNRKSGIGRLLYNELEKLLHQCNVTNLYACIAYNDVEDETLNKSSIYFHEKLGYKHVGKFHRCGYKFDRWYDIIWMEKVIANYEDCKEFISFKNKKM